MKNYLETISHLNKDFFENYLKIEKIILSQLGNEGKQYLFGRSNELFKN